MTELPRIDHSALDGDLASFASKIMERGISNHRPVALIGVFPPPSGGQGYYNQYIADMLRKLEIPAISVDVSQHPSPLPDYLHVPTRAKLVRILLRRRFGIIHLTASDTRMPGFEVIVGGYALLTRTPFIYNILAGRFGERLAAYSSVRKWILGRSLRNARILISNPSQEKDLRSLPFLSDVPVYVAGCTVPVSESICDDPALTDFLKSGNPGIVSIGALRPVYGFPLLLDAAAHLVEKGMEPHMLLVIAGDEDARIAEKIRSKIERHPHLQIRIEKEIPRSVVLGAVKAAHVLVRPTLADGDSLSIHEALQVGTPVVASDAAPRPCGVVLHTSGDAGSLADTIARVHRSGRVAAPKPEHSEHILLRRILLCYSQTLAGMR